MDKSLSCKSAPSVTQVAEAYHKVIKPESEFEISDVIFIRAKTGAGIVAKLLFNGKDEIVNENGNPISGDFLHVGLVNVDSSVWSEEEKIDERSTGQAPWYHGRPKGRGQAVLAPYLPSPDVLYNV